MDIFSVFVVLLSGSEVTASNRCIEYANLDKVAHGMSYLRDSLSAVGRNKKRTCREGDGNLACKKELARLREEIYKASDSVITVKGTQLRIHDQCDSLIMNNADSVSADLNADIANMWKVQPNEAGGVSSVSSINSAVRVINLLKRDVGRITVDSFERSIGFHKREGYRYNFPFWPIQGLVRAYRFDTGHMGYQFDVSYGENGLVTEVKKRWIY